MGIIDNIRAQGAAYRLTEEAIYAEVLREVESGIRRDGLWAKAFAESFGHEPTAKAKYITLRVQSLKDEIALVRKAMEDAADQEARSLEAARRQEQLRLENVRLEAERAAAAERVATEERKRAVAIQAARRADAEWNKKRVSDRKAMVRFSAFKWLMASLFCVIIVAGAGKSILMVLAAFGFMICLAVAILKFIDSLSATPPRE